MNNGSGNGQPIDVDPAAGLEQPGGPEAMNIDNSGTALTAGPSTAALNAAGPADSSLLSALNAVNTPTHSALTAATPTTLAAARTPTAPTLSANPALDLGVAALTNPEFVQALGIVSQALLAAQAASTPSPHSYAGALGSAAGGSGAGPSAAGAGSGFGGVAVAAAAAVSEMHGLASGTGMVHGQTRGMALTASAHAPVSAAMAGAAPLIGGMRRRAQIDKRYPMPEKFTPPKDHKAESVAYVEKYVHDLKSYVLFGVPDDIPAYLTFSQTSTGTFDLVQQMAAEHAHSPLSIDAVCDRIMKRYMPTVDRATDARMRLLNNQVVMKQGELLSEYRARFLAELALAQGAGRPAMSEEDKMLLYRRGMTPALVDACILNHESQRLDTFDAVHTYAEGCETKMRMQQSSSIGRSVARASVMQTGGNAHGRGKPARQSGGGGAKTRALNSFGPARPGVDSRGGRGNGWHNQGRKRGRDDTHHRHSNQPSTCRDMHGMLLTKAQLFTLFEEGKCWYCKENVGSPPSHMGATCPRNPNRRG